MGKTAGSILLGAAAIAAVAVGQPWLAGIIGGGIWGAAAAGVIVGVTVAGAGMLLGLGPSLPKPETTEQAIKTHIPPRVSAYGISRLYPAYILYETNSSGYACDAYAFHDGRADAIVQRYLNDDKVTLSGALVNQGPDGRYSDNVHVHTRLGLATETAISALVSRLPGIWTPSHRGDGVVTGALIAEPAKQEYYQKMYPNGVPVLSLAAKWQLCPDPAAANPADESGWTWTENSVRHLLHYKLKREGVDYATKIAPTIASWIAAAADCNVAMPLKNGGTEPRYRSCLAHKHTDPHKDVIGALLTTFDGWIAPRADGALVVYSGRFQEPTVNIGPDEIVAYNWDGVGIDDDRALNEIIVTYVSAEHDYTAPEADSWRDEDDIAARGQVLSQPLDAQVPSHAQGRRLAKRKMARAMALNRGTVTTNVAGRTARGQRYINLHIEEAGTVFYSGAAEIIALTRNMSTGGVTFFWVAADPNVDAWNPATEEGDPAAKGNRVAAAPLDAPSVTTALVAYAGATQDGTGARISITATGPDRPDLTWYARWRVQGSASWNEQRYSDVDPGPSVELVTSFVPIDKVIEVGVAYQVGDGRVSPFSSPPTLVDTDTNLTAPDAASSIELIAWSDTLDLSTPLIPQASTYRWRFYSPLDLTTVIREITTRERTVFYSSSQAASDGVRRDYIVKVAGVNAAGAGAEATSATFTNDPPAALASVAGVNGATVGAVSFTAPSPVLDAAGYMVFYSTTPGFDPLTQGYVASRGTPPVYLYGLAAATYYAKAAAYDLWTRHPIFLNLSAEVSFTVTTGGGTYGGGGGSEAETGGGGGYSEQPVVAP